jgi:Na+-transporting NADH:ubiquinone oxidoreductase subunit A
MPGSMRFKIRKGLDIPLVGAPEQRIHAAPPVRSVALLGNDTIGLKPAMAVGEGDRVKLGQVLYTDKRNPGVNYTSPGCGVVAAINRGERRALQSVVIRLDGDEAETFDCWPAGRLGDLPSTDVRRNLLAAGLWTAFRTRPFSRIPAVDSTPAAIFVPAIDSNPLAADPLVVIDGEQAAFTHGLLVIARLTDGPVYVCTAAGQRLPLPTEGRFRHAEFTGPHPAGLVGTHIHLLEPVSQNKTVWHVTYQDVIAIGQLFTSGRMPVERIVALGGPLVRQPRLMRTRLGASTADLIANEVFKGDARIISGSALSGHRAAGWAAFLGRYHSQITALREGREREFLGWMKPGAGKFSAVRAFAAHLLHRGPFELTTTLNGSPRAMVSIGNFEKVMPLDILATPLLKALLVRDTETAKALGCLELDEEDLALCSFVCSGKYEYGPALRETLHEIEING